MRIYLDLDSRKLMSSPIRALSKLEFKRRDNDTVELQFLRDATVQELEAGTSARLGIKINADYDSDFLALTTLTKSGTGTNTVYTGNLNLNTTAVAAAFTGEPVNFEAMLEVEWTTGDAVSSSQTLPVTLINDVIRGDEGTPATLPLFYTSETEDFKATQAQAIAGEDNGTWMTPLRTAQAIAASGAGPHTHPLADLTQSGATSGQVPTWNGTAWAPQTPASGGGGGGGTPAAHAASHASGGSDAITPANIGAASATHSHAISDTTGLQSALDGKANTSHSHSANDITSGVLNNNYTTAKSANITSAIVSRDASGNFSAGTITASLNGSALQLQTARTISLTGDVTGSVAFNGSANASITATVVDNSHNHTIANVTGLQTALDSKLNTSGTYTTIAVVAALPASPNANTIYIVTT